MLGTGGFHSSDARIESPAQFLSSYGLPLVGSYAMAARRHMHEFGTTSEQLAEIAVGVAEFAGYNPLARYRDPITIDDVLGSRMVADPLHKLDCCVITDGGGAFIMTTEERAARSRAASVYVLGRRGHADALEHHPDARLSPKWARRRRGPKPSVVRVSPSTTSTCCSSTTASPSPVLTMLEGLGFAGRWRGWRTGARRPLPQGRQVADEHRRRRLVVEPSGHARHLPHHRRRCASCAGRRSVQVPDCEIALACGSGGWLSCMGAVVMGKDRPS
jgi:hypothetical protein